MELSKVTEFIKPELLVLVAALYIIGMVLKSTEAFPDKKIPLWLVLIGIVLAAMWVFATSTVATGQDIALAMFTALVQGILVAGAAVLTNQVVKQQHKDE